MARSANPLQDPARVLRDFLRSTGTTARQNLAKDVADYFTETLDRENAIDKVPILDVQRPPAHYQHGSLVCFPAMIQDTSISPELYFARSKDGLPLGWGIHDPERTDQSDYDYNDLKECTVVWAVSIPGLSPWCFEAPLNIHSETQQPQPQKFPLQGPHVGAQLKVYQESELKVGETGLFYGIYQSEPLHSNAELEDSPDVPTIHVLFSKPLPLTVIPRTYSVSGASTTRKEIVTWIANEALGGDEFTAEWVLLSVIGRVRSRHPPLLTPSTTIARFPSPTTDLTANPTLYYVLQHLLPQISVLPLSLDGINRLPITPEMKDEDLHSGFLQHAKGATLLLTEGAITEGGINSQGIQNLRSIQETMQTQSLDYRFPFSSTFNFETDLNFIITTQGKKSTFFQTNFVVPLKPNATKNLYKTASEITLPDNDQLERFRAYIGGSKVGDVAVQEETSKYIEDDFVKKRATAEEKKPSSDDLIQLMLLTRLLALSFHADAITTEHWEDAKRLSEEVTRRFANEE